MIRASRRKRSKTRLGYGCRWSERRGLPRLARPSNEEQSVNASVTTDPQHERAVTNQRHFENENGLEPARPRRAEVETTATGARRHSWAYADRGGRRPDRVYALQLEEHRLAIDERRSSQRRGLGHADTIPGRRRMA